MADATVKAVTEANEREAGPAPGSEPEDEPLWIGPLYIGTKAEQQARADAMMRLLDEWMAEESGYDEETLPWLQKALNETRRAAGARLLFPEEDWPGRVCGAGRGRAPHSRARGRRSEGVVAARSSAAVAKAREQDAEAAQEAAAEEEPLVIAGVYIGTAAERRARAEEAHRLLAEWMADDSGYDQETWPELRRGLNENRRAVDAKPLFPAEETERRTGCP